MKCPACEHTLIVLEHENVEVDYCTRCKGIWLDAGELELLLGHRNGVEQVQDASVQHPEIKERRRPCPICGRRMAKRMDNHEPGVVYDACTRGHGLWFDDRELATIIERQTAPGAANDVTQWLRSLFG